MFSVSGQCGDISKVCGVWYQLIMTQFTHAYMIGESKKDVTPVC